MELLAFALILPLSTALPTTVRSAHERFNAWMIEHRKLYASEEAEARAFATWSANDLTIAAHNNAKLSFALSHNTYSDLTAAEFFGSRLGFATNATRRVNTKMHVATSTSVPSAVDWVTSGAVTSVKNQGQCGSCWSFSAAGAIEGAYAIASSVLMDLSEEDLVLCDTTNSGCNGGLMDTAFSWIATNGIAALSAYPYTSSTGTRGTCDATASNDPAVYVSGYVDVPADDEDALRSAVAQQPVSVAIEADQSVFQFYSGGVLDSSACGKAVDHGVLLVGYGTDGTSGLPYWKIKNSWGDSWGEAGYVRLARGSNMCGVASQASYPTGATGTTVKASTIVEEADAPPPAIKAEAK